AEAALGIEREVLGPDCEDAINSLEWLADLHEARDNWEVVQKVRREVLALRAKALGPGHWKVADARGGVARAEVAAKLGEDGRRKLAEAGRLPGEGWSLYSRGRYKEATDRARRALALNEELLGERHPDTLSSLNNLALVLQEQGDRAAARP